MRPRRLSDVLVRPLNFTVGGLPCDDRPVLLRAVDARAEPCGNGGRRWAQAPFFTTNPKHSPLRGWMLVFFLYFLPGLVALFFAVLSATNLAMQAGYPVPPLLRQLIFFAGCFGLVALVIRKETRAVAARVRTHDDHPGP